ncbi:MAG: Hsp20/alpha crystallin family protein [Calditrichaeota bacterium]|nr:Hsp20/alpha crystallin family protein [Calditrichota bacterium]
MTLVRCTPRPWSRAADFSPLQRQMVRLFDDFFGNDSGESDAHWSPRVDVVEHEDRFEVTAELPGLTRDEVKVELQNNVLTLSGEKRLDTERKDRGLYLTERAFGTFRRSFQFPGQIDAGKIDAEYRNGLLVVTLPKSEESRSRQIEVKVH